MNKKGFILYEALIMLVIISFILSITLTTNHQIRIKHYQIKKDIQQFYQQTNKHISIRKGCDNYCLANEVLLP